MLVNVPAYAAIFGCGILGYVFLLLFNLLTESKHTSIVLWISLSWFTIIIGLMCGTDCTIDNGTPELLLLWFLMLTTLAKMFQKKLL